jgi:hypothetical protein
VSLQSEVFLCLQVAPLCLLRFRKGISRGSWYALDIVSCSDSGSNQRYNLYFCKFSARNTLSPTNPFSPKSLGLVNGCSTIVEYSITGQIYDSRTIFNCSILLFSTSFMIKNIANRVWTFRSRILEVPSIVSPDHLIGIIKGYLSPCLY